MDLAHNLHRYLHGDSGSIGRQANARYSSFDYCFNYFQSFRESGDTVALSSPANLQLSCLHLGFYLASWGMLRGSADLLQRSVRHYVPIIEEIANADPTLWDLDADQYTEANIERLLQQASAIRRANNGMSDILVTKIMLGTFGSVPAFDTYFCRGLKVSAFSARALMKVGEFYRINSEVIDRSRVRTLDFISGEQTLRPYTRAKVIDMAFFVEGMS